jgi:hypothetical protein
MSDVLNSSFLFIIVDMTDIKADREGLVDLYAKKKWKEKHALLSGGCIFIIIIQYILNVTFIPCVKKERPDQIWFLECLVCSLGIRFSE